MQRFPSELKKRAFLDYRKPERTQDVFIQTVVDVRRGVDRLLYRSDMWAEALAPSLAVCSGVEKRMGAYESQRDLAQGPRFEILRSAPVTEDRALAIFNCSTARES